MARAWVEDTWHDRQGNRTALYGHGSRWKAYVPQPANVNGGRRAPRSIKRFRTKIEAERYIADVEQAKRQGTYFDPRDAKLTFKSAAEEWLPQQLHVKASTLRRYRRDLDNYVLPQWASRELGTIGRREAQAWVGQLAAGTAPAAYRGRGGGPDQPLVPAAMNKPLSPKSITAVVQVASAVLRWAVESELAISNPFKGLRRPREGSHEHIYLNHREVEALAQAALDVTGRESDRVLVYLLAYTGLRINEALALRVSSLSLARGRIYVGEAWSSDVRGNAVLDTPKSSRTRWVPVMPYVGAMLASLVDGMEPNDFVFQAPRGGPVIAHNWRGRVFNRARAEAGLPVGLTPHKLRHTAASMAIAGGADVKIVQQMLGHADATITLNTYTHMWHDKLDEVSSAMDAAREAEFARSAPANVTKM